METYEDQLILGLKESSYSDFEKLYELYIDRLYSFVYSISKSHADTNDIVQEVFLRIWQLRESIATGTSFKAYLFNIARNLVIDSFRKNLANTEFCTYIQHLQETSENEILEDDVIRSEFSASLSHAKNRLTPRQKDIFELSKEQHLTNDEIATRLNISEKTVRNQLSLAIAALRKELSHYSPLLLIAYSIFREF